MGRYTLPDYRRRSDALMYALLLAGGTAFFYGLYRLHMLAVAEAP